MIRFLYGFDCCAFSCGEIMNYDRRIVENLKRSSSESGMPFVKVAFYFSCLVLVLTVLLRAFGHA